MAQIAFTQPALLAMGALFLNLLVDFREAPSTVVADRIVDVRFNTNPRYGALDQAREDTLRRLRDRLADAPGVAAVARQERGDDFFVAVHPADAVPGVEPIERLEVRAHAAPAGYFPLMEMPIVRGRDFTAADRTDHRTLVIDSQLARRLWGSADPIGRRLQSAGPNERNIAEFVVVGVVDVQTPPDDSDRAYRVYVPEPRLTTHLLVRTQGPADAVIPVIRSVANAEAPELPIISVQTLAATEANERRSILRGISAVGGAGAMALFLAAIGLYSVVAFAVGQRIREIGIRTALGAGRRRVVGMFLYRGLRLSLVGLAIGLTLSVIGARLIAAAEGIEPPAGILWLATVVAGFVIGVTLLATWIPARRAARIDPLQALRVE
jgi:putative ABC transport system permease protein